MQFTVDQRLKLEALRRGVNGTWSQVAMIVAMIVFLPPSSGLLYYYTAAALLILILTGRWVLFKSSGTRESMITKFSISIFVSLSTAALWAFLISFAIYHFGVKSFEGILHIFLICGLLAAVMYSLSPVPSNQRAYILLLGLPVSVVIYFSQENRFSFAGIMLFVFVIYLFTASRGHSSDLRSAFELEERLFVENMKLQEVVNSVPGFMIFVSKQGTRLHSSQSGQDVIRSPLLEAEIQEFLNSGQKKQLKELEFNLEKHHSFIVSFERIHSIEGGVIIFGLPIDELKEVQRQLEIQKAQALYSAKLAGIGILASGVAHEINNPLAIISMNSEALRNKLTESNIDESIWKKKTNTIIDTVNRIAQIIRSLQQLSREDVLSEEGAIDLNRIVNEVKDVSVARLDKIGAKFFYEDKGPVRVRGNHVELGQVLLNLINNSFDAIKESSQKEITVRLIDGPQEVTLEVEDTGVGIEGDAIENLFQPFYSTKDVGSGTGLSLSISRSILLSHGGSISLVKPKNPTIFKVTMKKV